jgi:NAD-dependent deacetylase
VSADTASEVTARDTAPLDGDLDSWLGTTLARPGRVVFLTGAGVSAESGVPTFRGKDGYWMVGSRNYHAQELATHQQFARTPADVWGWYLHRLRTCRAAEPNPAHAAIAALGAALAERFLLITQNVDGLHRRAGSPHETTYEIHGNIAWMRCSAQCEGLTPVPDAVADEGPLSARASAALRCSSCSAWMRPHVLWFDEVYDEPLFRFESSLRAVDGAALLVVVGTTGMTTLPYRIGERAAQRGLPTLVINPEPNPFSELVHAHGTGHFLPGLAGEWVPKVARQIEAVVARLAAS